jgi:pimeloyl-ACP methyl ester carboxylesterase
VTRSLLCAVLVLILTVLVDCAVAASDAVPLPVDLKTQIFRYLDSMDTDEAARALQPLLSDPNITIDQAVRIIQTERAYPSQPTGTFPDERIDVRGHVYNLTLSVPLTYQPTNGYGLVVCLHGAGFTGEAYLERWQARLGGEYVLACPTVPMGAWFTRGAEELVLATIRSVQRRYHIDPDRIFLTGMSNGGIGTWVIGMHDAPLFAGLAPMASGLDNVLMPFLANLRSTPVYIIHGAKDEVMPVELSRSITKELTRLGYPFVYREHDREHPMAGGHYFPKEELAELVTWFNAQRRNPLPTTVTVVREASHLQQFGWVRIDATDPIAAFSEDLISKRDDMIKRREYARLDASIVAPNRIEVQADRVQRYSLFLNEQLIDSSKPLVVLTNGQVSFEGLVTPSLEILLRQARLRQDSRQLFPIHLAIQVRKQPR